MARCGTAQQPSPWTLLYCSQQARQGGLTRLDKGWPGLHPFPRSPEGRQKLMSAPEPLRPLPDTPWRAHTRPQSRPPAGTVVSGTPPGSWTRREERSHKGPTCSLLGTWTCAQVPPWVERRVRAPASRPATLSHSLAPLGVTATMLHRKPGSEGRAEGAAYTTSGSIPGTPRGPP